MFISSIVNFHFTFLRNPIIHLFIFYSLPSFLSSSKQFTHSFSQVQYLLLLSSSFSFHSLSGRFNFSLLSFTLFIIPIISFFPRCLFNFQFSQCSSCPINSFIYLTFSNDILYATYKVIQSLSEDII